MKRIGAVAMALATALATVGCGHLVLLHDPLSAAEHNDLGVAYEAQGRLDLARTQYRAALKKDHRLARARLNLGNVEAARGRWPQAEREYRRALRLDPGSADAMNNLATALVRRRRLDEAQHWAAGAVAIGGARDSIYRATLAEVAAARRGPTAPRAP